MKLAAYFMSQKPREELEKILDFCEDQLKVLPAYPNSHLGTAGVFSAPAPLTYKEAVLRRFDELKILFN